MTDETPWKFIEKRSSCWDEVATALTADIMKQGLHAGQLKWVDAHVNPDGTKILTAYWDETVPLVGEDADLLDLRWHTLHSDAEWSTLYDSACGFCNDLCRGQLVSVTCSCNTGPRHVCFVFYDANTKGDVPRLQLKWVSAAGGSWNGAANKIEEQLREHASLHPVVSVDAHNSSPDDPALFVGFYDAGDSVPSKVGGLAFTHQNSEYAWFKFYERAVQEAAYFELSPIAITSSVNCKGYSVTFTWYRERPLAPCGLKRTREGEAVERDSLRVMSFNIWCSGGDSLPRTCDVIRRTAPDLVGLQECSQKTASLIARKCGMYTAGNSQAVLSRWPIEPVAGEVATGRGHYRTCPSDSLTIDFYNVHLNAYPYPPYVLHRDGKSTEQAASVELQRQFPNLLTVLGQIWAHKSERSLVFLTGDFNCPSHFDYPSGPAWPCSIACKGIGLVDSFNEARSSGIMGSGCENTWSPKSDQEPDGVHDRIDFIYYSGDTLKLERSCHLDGSNSGVPAWPSDHRAVLSDFRLSPNA